MKEGKLQPFPSAACAFGESDVSILCYVDDTLILRNDMRSLTNLKKSLTRRLLVNDLGGAAGYPGIKIVWTERRGTLRNKNTLRNELTKGVSKSIVYWIPCSLGGDVCTPSEKEGDTDFHYRLVTRSLLYLEKRKRPYTAVATCKLDRDVEQPSDKHVKAVVKLIIYLHSACSHGIPLDRGATYQLRAHIVFIWGGKLKTRRRYRSGFVVNVRKCLSLLSQ